MLSLCYDKLKKLEEQDEELRIIDDIKNGYFVGPRSKHQIIKEELRKMVANSRQTQYTIDDMRFGSIAANEEQQLNKLCSTQGCLAKIKLESNEKIYSVPKSCVGKDASELMPAAMSIDIRIGDLADQSVDMVVIPSTSQYLLDNILKRAGNAVVKEVNEAMRDDGITSSGLETESGQLLCQRLFFLPWTTQKLDDVTLRQTIETFFTTAIQRALNTGKTSLAFPAIGCGLLGYDPNIIAEIILDETQRYANYNLKILIILLPDMIENYRIFSIKLAELRHKTVEKSPTMFSYLYKSKFYLFSVHHVESFQIFYTSI